jgi:tRNA A37 methylthiotransferase MiaB
VKYILKESIKLGSDAHACIGVDVIVGFPGETDEHFLETYRLNEMDISYLHVFKYSERDNTEVAQMDGVVRACKKEVKCFEDYLLKNDALLRKSIRI